MSQASSEFSNKPVTLETYEWDNVWWEKTELREVLRIMYIGDSISCGVRSRANSLSQERFLFDGFASSKALDNPFLQDSIRLFARQEGYQNLIVFNNGLHGFHLSEDEYAEHYEAVVKFLMREFSETPLAILLTTRVKDAQTNERVRNRNAKAIEIAHKYHLPVFDFFSVSEEHATLQCSDGVHYSDAGYEKLAQYLLNSIETILK